MSSYPFSPFAAISQHVPMVMRVVAQNDRLHDQSRPHTRRTTRGTRTCRGRASRGCETAQQRHKGWHPSEEHDLLDLDNDELDKLHNLTRDQELHSVLGDVLGFAELLLEAEINVVGDKVPDCSN